MDLREAAAQGPSRHPWETARLWVLRRLISAYVRLDRDPVIVDIGCGDAFVLGELARTFPAARCYGVDEGLDTNAIEGLQRSQPPNVKLFRNLDDVPGDRAASLILMMDVLEHIEDDRAFLTDLRSRPIVAPTTSIVVTVPAYRVLFSAQDVFLHHFRRYAMTELRERLERTGFPATAIGHFFATLLPARAMQIAAERLLPSRRQRAAGLSSYRGSAATSALLHSVLVADAAAALLLRRVGVTLPGLSIYAVCRPSA